MLLSAYPLFEIVKWATRSPYWRRRSPIWYVAIAVLRGMIQHTYKSHPLYLSTDLVLHLNTRFGSPYQTHLHIYSANRDFTLLNVISITNNVTTPMSSFSFAYRVGFWVCAISGHVVCSPLIGHLQEAQLNPLSQLHWAGNGTCFRVYYRWDPALSWGEDWVRCWFNQGTAESG